MPTYKTLTNNEFMMSEGSKEGRIHLEHGPNALTYVPESSNFWRGPNDAFTYFVCLGELTPVGLYKTPSGRDSRQKVNKYPVLGIAELQVSPTDPNEVWLKYVSVHAKHHGQGIGRELGRMVAKHMQGTGKHLRRSYSSDIALSGGYQSYMDGVLDEHGVPWSQSGRDNDYEMS